MYSVTKQFQSCFMKGLTLSRVRVDDSCNILCDCTHFYRRDERCRKFRNMCSHRLHTNDPMIIGSCHHTEKTTLIACVHCKRSAIGGKWEFARHGVGVSWP